jgi:hypothetical protein
MDTRRSRLKNLVVICALSSLSGCAVSGGLISDEKIVSAYQADSESFEELVRSAIPGTGPADEFSVDSFFTDQVDPKLKSGLGVQKYAREFRGCRHVLVLDSRTEDSMDLYREEKGLVFVDERPCHSPLTDSPSLNSFESYGLVNKSGLNEAWKYRRVGQRWYIFLHQFYRSFLH